MFSVRAASVFSGPVWPGPTPPRPTNPGAARAEEELRDAACACGHCGSGLPSRFGDYWLYGCGWNGCFLGFGVTASAHWLYGCGFLRAQRVSLGRAIMWGTVDSAHRGRRGSSF